MPIILLGKLQTEIRRNSGYVKQLVKGATAFFGGVSVPIHVETGFKVDYAVADHARLRELDIGILYNFGQFIDEPPEITVSYYSDETTGFKVEYFVDDRQYPQGYPISFNWMALG